MAKCRAIKTKKQVRLKYKVQENKKTWWGEILRTRPDRPWGPPSLLYNGYRVSFSGVTRLGRVITQPPPFSGDVKERVELYHLDLFKGGLFCFFVFITPFHQHSLLCNVDVCKKTVIPHFKVRVP
jgi:hypothetical protein